MKLKLEKINSIDADEAYACCKSDIICTNPAGKSALGRAFHHTFGFSGLVKKKNGGIGVDLASNDNTEEIRIFF